MSVALILPGLSSPFKGDHYRGYKSLAKAAKKRGYDKVEIGCFPGQWDANDKREGTLSPTSATNAIIQYMQELENDSTSFHIIAHSFGVNAALVASVDRDWKSLEKLILWGPIPFWISWRAFWKGVNREALAHGTLMDDHTFFQELVPVEHLIGKIQCHTVIAAGKMDQYCPTYYFDYLQHVASEHENSAIEFRTAANCQHGVRPDDVGWSDYVDALFS